MSSKKFPPLKPIVGQPDSFRDERSTFLKSETLIEQRDVLIAELRRFAREISPELFYQEMERVYRALGHSIPVSVRRCLAELAKLVEDGFDRYAVPTTIEGNRKSTLEVFQDLQYLDVTKFLRGFEEALFDFYVFAELRKTIESRNRPNDVRRRRNYSPTFDCPLSGPNSNRGRIVEDFQADIAAELFADGLKVLALFRAEDLDFDSYELATNLPTTYYHPIHLQRVLNTLGKTQNDATRTITVGDVWDRVLDDPRTSIARLIYEIESIDNPKLATSHREPRPRINNSNKPESLDEKVHPSTGLGKKSKDPSRFRSVPQTREELSTARTESKTPVRLTLIRGGLS